MPGGGERGEWAGGVLVCSLFPGLGVRCGSCVVVVQRSAGRAVCGLWLCCSHCAGCVGAPTPTPATTIVFCRQSAALAGDVQGVPVREPRVVCSSARGVRSARSAGGRGVGRGASHLTYLPEKAFSARWAERIAGVCGLSERRRRTRPPAILSAHRALRVTSAKCRGPARVTKQTPVSRTEKSGGHRTFLFRVRTGHTNRSLTGDKCGLSAKTRERRGKRSAMERSGYSR